MKLGSDFEPTSSFTRQDELFPGKWVDDGSIDGAYCTKQKAHPKDSFYAQQDREYDRRQAAKLVTTFDDKISSEPLPNEMFLHPIGLPYAIGLDWNEKAPFQEELFHEVAIGTKPDHHRAARFTGSAFDWMAGHIYRKLNEHNSKGRFLLALRDHPKWVEIYVRRYLTDLCKHAAIETGEAVKVDFAKTPVDLVEHLKLFFSDEVEALRFTGP